VAEHHEVQAPEQTLVQAEVLVICELLGVRKGIAVADDFEGCPAVSI
jgi:hypothetical protein